MRKLAILTSGGDAPGMNTSVRALVRLAYNHFDEVIGVMHGYDGLINAEFVSLSPYLTQNIMMQGGTILKSSRSPAFRTDEGQAKAKSNLDDNGITHLVVIGGNGTTQGIFEFSKKHKINFVVIPSTIDNDTFGTDLTIGHSTAIQTIVDSLDKLRTTSNSHERFFFVEVMGRDCGRLALAGGLAGGAELILTPELPIAPEKILSVIDNLLSSHKNSFSVVATEGAPATLLRSLIPSLSSHPAMIVLGHLQRGGSPVATDRILATRFSEMAISLLLNGETSRLITINDDQISHMAISDSAGKTKGLDTKLLSLYQKLSCF